MGLSEKASPLGLPVFPLLILPNSAAQSTVSHKFSLIFWG
jgi:hypothetical protein